MWFFFSLLAFAATPPQISVPGGKISVIFSSRAPKLRAASEADVLAFVGQSATPVTRYYGKFPVPRLRVEVMPSDHHGAGLFGREFHGERIELYIGQNAGPERLDGDQMLTHEMFHLGFPDLDQEYAWVEEGLATYLAHLSRARVAQTSEAEFWQDARSGFQDAQRKPGEPGLAEEENYHRFYWGGALLWFEIDLAIRDHSKGTRSLDTVTRAILSAHGTNAHRWSLERLARAVDHTAGFPVFRKWYQRLGFTNHCVDLETQWRQLGLNFHGERGELDDKASLAAMRRALMKNLR